MAIVSALKPNSIADNVSRFFSILFLAVPGFWLGMLIVLALLFWFGYRAPLAGVSLLQDPIANLQIVIGPAIVLGLGQAAYIARMARSSLLEVIREDYVRTARAKGLNGRNVISLHALPNALLPVITLSGILLGFVLAGSIPVERAFGVPGLGYAMFTAVSERDIFVMQNLVFLYSVVFVILNIAGRRDDRLARPEDPLPMTAVEPGEPDPSSTSRRAAAERSRLRRIARGLRNFVRRSPFSAFWGCIAAAILVMAIAAPLIAPYEPLKSDFRAMSKPPGAAHYFGTDQIGRDTLSAASSTAAAPR